MADGPETRATKPESMFFNARREAAEAAPGSPERTGRTGCSFTTELRGRFVGKRRPCVGKTRYLFCRRPLIYRILTPGSNPLQKRRKTGNEPRPRCIMGTVG